MLEVKTNTVGSSCMQSGKIRLQVDWRGVKITYFAPLAKGTPHWDALPAHHEPHRAPADAVPPLHLSGVPDASPAVNVSGGNPLPLS